jgi:hypothetical protein
MKTSGRKTVKVTTTSAPMAVKASSTRSSKGTSDGGPTSEEISRRSYELFLERGGTHGHDVEDWLRAESELRAG